MSEVKIEKVTYAGWHNCLHIFNNLVEVIVTTDVGPRILRYGFLGRENELCEVDKTKGLTGAKDWHIYGGHRLWHSPEAMPRTYIPDNRPVSYVKIKNGIHTIQNVEPATQIEKEMEVSLEPTTSRVKIVHRLVNKGVWPIELAAWALTVLAPGGKAVIPQTTRDTGLLGNRVLTLWPYSRMNDPRVYWGEKFIVLQQDAGLKTPFKLGVSNEDGWAAYFNHNHLFLKRFSYFQGAKYPDFGVSCEIYTNDFMLEMESLSPLLRTEPDGLIEHVEYWNLFESIPPVSNDESSTRKIITPILNCVSSGHCEQTP